MPSINLKDMKWDASAPLRVLLYGPAGIGKTRLVGSFPKPMKLFDFDHKLKCLAGQDIEVESYSLDDKTKAADELDRFLKDFRKAKLEPWATLGFESLSTMDPMAMQWVIKKSGKLVDVPELQHFGRHSDFFTFLFLEFNSATLAKNIVLTAHEHYVIEDESKLHRITPLISGQKILTKIPAMFEEVWYYNYGPPSTTGQPIRRLYYRPFGKAIANTSSLSGVGYIDDPTYAKVLAEIQKGQGGK